MCRFGPLEIAYDERVLTPRAWTFEQSRWAADLAEAAGAGSLLELCAGAGQIGLAAAVLADRDLVQVEMSEAAAGYARANAGRAGWADRVQVRVAPLEHSLDPGERFPVVIADPPYLRTQDVGRFPGDPRLAIDGGKDGFVVVRTCLALAALHLSGGGVLVLQVAGPRQAEDVTAHAVATSSPLRPEETRVVDDERALVLLRRSG